MFKRMQALAVLLIFSLVALGGRILYLSYFQSKSAAVQGSEHAEYFGTNRGLILDRKMKALVETQTQKVTSAVNPSFSLAVPERYANRQLCAHFIGYLDADNNGVSGIEKDYNAFLKAIENQIALKTYKDARGNTLLGKGTVVDESRRCTDSGIMLTIDRDIQSITQTAAKRVKSGAVVVMDSDSGKLLASVSMPQFHPNQVDAAMRQKGTPLVNRVLQSYNVGSVFKVVVCLAALESGIDEGFCYRCTGRILCGGRAFHCHKEDGHGSITMKQALAQSCNTYFIALAQKIGAEKMLEICNRLSIKESIRLSDSIVSEAGNLPLSRDLSSPAALANFSFGQGELLASPLWLCRLYAAIHNGGYLVQPQLVQAKVVHGKQEAIGSQKSAQKQVFKHEHAQLLMRFLEETVKSGTGKAANVKYCTVAGKTATAQTGKFIKKKEILISYFIGLFSIKGEKYTVFVMCDNGSSGAADCVPLFQEICEKICRMQ